jgi:hypothetical protein
VTAPPERDWDEALNELLLQESQRPDGEDPAGRPQLDAALPEPEIKLRETAVLVLGFDDPNFMSALLKAAHLSARIVADSGMGFAVLRDSTEAGSVEAALRLSKLLTGVLVCLLHQGPSADPMANELQGHLYLDGEERPMDAPGLLLTQMPGLLEDLLLDPEGSEPLLEQGADTQDMSTAQAIGIITNRMRSSGGRSKRSNRKPKKAAGGAERQDEEA